MEHSGRGDAVPNRHRGTPLLITFGLPEDLEFGPTSEGRNCDKVEIYHSSGRPYFSGVPGFGRTIDESVKSLRSTIDKRAPSELIICGTGLGGYAALVFGALLGADRIVAVEPASHLIQAELELYNDRRWQRESASVPDPSLASQYAATRLLEAFAGEAFVLFGTGRHTPCGQAAHLNLIHAQWLARSGRVILVPLPQFRAGSCDELSRRGDLSQLLNRYLFEENVPLEAAGDDPRPDAVPLDEVKPLLLSIRESSTDPAGGTRHQYVTIGDGNAPEVRNVDDGVRRWIAENLMLGEPPESIARRMRMVGFGEATAAAEIRLASESPYLLGAKRLQNRLRKRDWLLDIYRTLWGLDRTTAVVNRRRGLPRDEFFHNYYLANRPLILEGELDREVASKDWTLEEMARRVGDRAVRVRLNMNESNSDAPFRPLPSQLMPFSHFVQKIQNVGQSGDFRLTTEDAENREAMDEILDRRTFLTAYRRDEDDRTARLRITPAGVMDGVRHEASNVFVTVTMGRLRVKLVPPWELPRMRNTCRNLSEHHGSRLSTGPQIGPAQLRALECELGPGDVLFLPVAWWYSLESVEPSADLWFSDFSQPNEFPPVDLGDGWM